ncbi:peptidoglycan-binding domain-containing protein [Kribbella sp. NPDC051936]|uniref:peptidoglycan-binding domain-containing protein n=1 Tax=Kribbella sp. NPDC051936 TaxID=3154946 RepID=UPI003422D6A5
MPNAFLDKVSLGRDSSGRPLVVNRRTMAMLEAAERKLGRKLVIVQGSFLAGKAAKRSGPTHNRAGVIDIRTKDQTPAQQAQTLLELRKISFAAFHRTTKQGFADHIHAVAIGDPGLDPSAARQVEAYKNGRDGLKGNGPLDGPRVKITVFPLTMPSSIAPAVRTARPVVHLASVQAQFRAGGTKALPDVKTIQLALNARLKLTLLVDGKAGKFTREAYKKHQKAIGSAPKFIDGIPGPKDLTNLGLGRFQVI